MTERRYSLREVDVMRANLYTIQIARTGDSSCFSPPSREEIERRLNTCLIAGVDPKELADAAKEAAWYAQHPYEHKLLKDMGKWLYGGG
jgi:hypothetical protein